ncbi:ABC transporter substrate-binding protein [Pseudochelatococcus sp. G4_1912]|uniref:ABC transporter substrate-binding protein n=1 Tax=Pseudochelatococcus sp. G4_1912 TaxID=3114288 RepID=UPI0039C6852A
MFSRNFTGKTAAIALAAATVFSSFSHAQAQEAETLTMAVYGGTFEEGWKKAIIEPFQAANPNIKIQTTQGLTFQNLATMRAQKDNVKVDVLLMDEVAANQALAEGLVEPLDVSQIPNLADLYPTFRVKDDPFAKFMFASAVVAYDSNTLKEPPASYKDFWKPEFKGKIAVNNLDSTVGLIFFVTINEIYGGTLDNVEPGFEAMKKLKPSIVTFPTQHAQLAQLLTNGDVVMAPWVSDRVISQQKAGSSLRLAIPSDGGIVNEAVIVVAKGTKHKDAAFKYINYVLSPEGQAANAKYTFISPVNSKAVLDEETAKIVPNGPEVMKTVRRPDWQKINANSPKWLERWNREITQ